MRILITGANQPLGRAVAQHWQNRHQLTLTATDDLRNENEVAPLVKDIEAILHIANFAPAALSGPGAEQDRLDIAARGTYVLLQEALKAGVERLILISTLAQFGSYPANYVIDETWQPDPEPNADGLAPYLSEITCREFAREGGINTLCLRLGSIDEADGTSLKTALAAIDGALRFSFQPLGYRWQLFHVSDSDRFNTTATEQKLCQSHSNGGA